MENNKAKKNTWQKYIIIICFMLIGAVCGFLIIKFIDNISTDKSIGEKIAILIGMIFIIYIAVIFQIIIHESGHLIFGLISGYSFCSFRIFNIMWLKSNGRISIKKFSLAGTAGQCLMSPPDMKDGRIPVVMYNLGGALMNIIASAVFMILYFFFFYMPFISSVMLIHAVTGILLAIMNGIPINTEMISNDGANALELSQSKESVRYFWLQMKINERTSDGIRLKDMPDEWFVFPSDESMKNSLAAAIGVFVCNRLMDKHNFGDAEQLMSNMLKTENGMAGIYRNLMVCDRMYCELISENRREVIDNMFTDEQKNFMKQMKGFPSVIRTEYTYALLCDRNIEKAEKIRRNFELCSKKYPYPGDIQSERELINIADEKYEEYNL